MMFCEGNSMVEFQLPKLITRVRFPSLAPVIFLLMLSGCVAVDKSAPGVKGPQPITGPSPVETTTAKPSGVYHKVVKGETIWRIAQAYGVTIDQIISANNIPNGAVIEKNQLLLIPGKQAKIEVIKQVKLKAHFLPMTSTARPNPNAPIANPALAMAKILPVSLSATPISW